MVQTSQRIAEQLQSYLGPTRKHALKAVESPLELIKSCVGYGHDVWVSGFGRLRVKQKPERMGRNPSCGGKVVLRQRRVVTFKCSGQWRAAINTY